MFFNIKLQKFIQLYAFLILLFAFSVASFCAGIQLNSTAAFTLSGVLLTIFSVVYCSGVLGYKVTSNHISIEAQVQNLEQQNQELKAAVTALIKSIYVVSDGSSQLGGMPAHHDNLLDGYLSPISHLINKDPKEEAFKDIKTVSGKP